MARRDFIAIFSVILLACGCGEAPPFDFVPVSGRATLDGQPLIEVAIDFVPKAGEDGMAGPRSYAVTDADGRFELELSRPAGRSGAVPGKHTVFFLDKPNPDAKNADAPDAFLPTVPEKYQAGVPFTVPTEGTDAANFDL
ncbi:MAG: hypothetical protein AAF532_00630 [Planctomycetota bacterium]